MNYSIRRFDPCDVSSALFYFPHITDYSAALSENISYDEWLAVTKQLYHRFKSMIATHAFHYLRNFNNHYLMKTAHMITLSIHSYDEAALFPSLFLAVTHHTISVSVFFSCVRALDTANGFKHTYTGCPWMFTFPQQWKDWCGIIHWWLTGFHNGTTPDTKSSPGSAWLVSFFKYANWKVENK